MGVSSPLIPAPSLILRGRLVANATCDSRARAPALCRETRTRGSARQCVDAIEAMLPSADAGAPALVMAACAAPRVKNNFFLVARKTRTENLD